VNGAPARARSSSSAFHPVVQVEPENKPKGQKQEEIDMADAWVLRLSDWSPSRAPMHNGQCTFPLRRSGARTRCERPTRGQATPGKSHLSSDAQLNGKLWTMLIVIACELQIVSQRSANSGSPDA
jgi:hypothetical protein